MKAPFLAGVVGLAFGIAPAHAQPVTADTSCAEIGGVNPQFLANVMMMQVQAVMSGALAPGTVNDQAEWLNRFVDISPTGDAGVNTAAGLQSSTDSAFGGGPSEAERLDTANRARAEAASLLPTLTNACDANPSEPLLYAMQSVLHTAGYGNAPVAAAFAPPRAPSPAPATSGAMATQAAPAAPNPFEDGLKAREAWEGWFATLSGAYRAGAEYWAGQRSLPHPSSCRRQDGASRGTFTDGCEAAQRKLIVSDVRRETEPEFSRGWNSLPSSK